MINKSIVIIKRMAAFSLILCCLVFSCALSEEKILIDPENGIWQYESPREKIEIKKVTDELNKLIWFEVHLYLSSQHPLITMATNPDKPGTNYQTPVQIARTNHYVFAINDDFFGYRISHKHTIGIVIRNKKIISSATYSRSNSKTPNLDCMALYPDGTAEVYRSFELTAEEYINKGAYTVLAFGPILIRDGVMNDLLNSYWKNREPRVGLGLVEPYHYVVVVIEGRHKKSPGANLKLLAEKLMDMGAVQALNLDGGQTSALVFMGEKLNKTSEYSASGHMRTITGMLAAGISDQVPEYEAPKK